MTPEQIRKLSDSLKVVAGHEGGREALNAFCSYFYDEAVDAVTAPKTTNEERNYWSGAMGCALEIRRHFDDLLSGDYVRWPMMHGEDKDA